MVGAAEAGEGARDAAVLLAEPRYQLTDEPEAEERDAGDHHRLDQVEERTETDAVAEAQDQRHNAGQKAQAEQRGAENTEEEHRLAAEAELEPHREEVEHADRNP